MAEPQAKRVKVEEGSVRSAFTCSAHDVFEFRLVCSRDQDELRQEVESGGMAFKAEFLHQHFGENEEIKGYQGLSIVVWVHAQTYHLWVDMKWKAKRPGADKLSKIFDEKLVAGYSTNRDDFIQAVVESSASMPNLYDLGDTVASVAAKDGGPDLLIKRHTIAKADPAVKALHERMEPLLLFFIDGASLIDNTDPDWELLLVVVPHTKSKASGTLVVGMQTLYNFWAYYGPRLRLSQVYVVDAWQGRGLGKALLACAYRMAASKRCIDLTIEDPTPNLQRVREKLEVEMLSSIPWVMAQARKCIEAAGRGEQVWPALPLPPLPPQEQQPSETSAAANPYGVPPATAAQAAAGGSSNAAAAAQQLLEQQTGSGGVMEASVSTVAAGEQQQQQGSKEPSPSHSADGTAVVHLTATAHASSAPDSTPAGGSTAGRSGGGGGGGGGGPLAPSSAFITRITAETKINKNQARVVWEALLWCTPGAVESPACRAVLHGLIRRRLEALHFATVGRSAAAKRFVEIAYDNYFLYRPPAAAATRQQQQGGSGSGSDMLDVAGASAAGSGAGPSTSTEPQGQQQDQKEQQQQQGELVGRLNLVTITPEEKAAKMAEVFDERQGQLDTLRSLLKRRSGNGASTAAVAAATTTGGAAAPAVRRRVVIAPCPVAPGAVSGADIPSKAASFAQGAGGDMSAKNAMEMDAAPTKQLAPAEAAQAQQPGSAAACTSAPMDVAQQE